MDIRHRRDDSAIPSALDARYIIKEHYLSPHDMVVIFANRTVLNSMKRIFCRTNPILFCFILQRHGPGSLQLDEEMKRCASHTSARRTGSNTPSVARCLPTCGPGKRQGDTRCLAAGAFGWLPLS